MRRRTSERSKSGPDTSTKSTSTRSRESWSPRLATRRVGIIAPRPGGVDQIDAEQPQGFLLAGRFGVEQAGVQDDLARLAAGLVLEPDAKPSHPVLAPAIAPRRRGVREDEERGRGAPRRRERLQQRRILAVEHLLDPLAAHVAMALAVDAVAHRHVVRADRLGDGPGGAAHGEEPPPDLLAGADLRDRPVPGAVDIELERLLGGGQGLGWHGSVDPGRATLASRRREPCRAAPPPAASSRWARTRPSSRRRPGARCPGPPDSC